MDFFISLAHSGKKWRSAVGCKQKTMRQSEHRQVFLHGEKGKKRAGTKNNEKNLAISGMVSYNKNKNLLTDRIPDNHGTSGKKGKDTNHDRPDARRGYCGAEKDQR